jgi:hypothetical protein
VRKAKKISVLKESFTDIIFFQHSNMSHFIKGFCKLGFNEHGAIFVAGLKEEKGKTRDS